MTHSLRDDIRTKYKRRIMITGGAGFIGSHVVRLFVSIHPDWFIVNFDKLTYAGNTENNSDIANCPNYQFVLGDITNRTDVLNTLWDYDITDIINLAAETHVDNSIKDPLCFVKTNVIGTAQLLQCAYEFWYEKRRIDTSRFYHISTDEVYGSLELDTEDKFVETMKYMPHSPYSASKASSDHLVRAFGDTYGMNTVVSNCSNNYGPNQHNEKLIPLTISKILKNEKIPVYGDGKNIRDWLYVEDHADAIETIFTKGKKGETYNIGGNCELQNIEIINKIINTIADFCSHSPEEKNLLEKKYRALISFVEDRKGHDRRYAIDASKIKRELGWSPNFEFDKSIGITVLWYLEHQK